MWWHLALLKPQHCPTCAAWTACQGVALLAEELERLVEEGHAAAAVYVHHATPVIQHRSMTSAVGAWTVGWEQYVKSGVSTSLQQLPL